MSALRAKQSLGRTKNTTSHPKKQPRNHGPSALWPLLLLVDHLRPFCSTARIDMVMGNPAYNRRRLNQAGGGVYNPTIHNDDLCRKNTPSTAPMQQWIAATCGPSAPNLLNSVR